LASNIHSDFQDGGAGAIDDILIEKEFTYA